MNLHLQGLSMLLLATGCTSQQKTTDFFATQDQFAANRELQTLVFDSMGYDTMLGHVVESLLDLDCTIQETSKPFGVISAKGSWRWYTGNLWMMPQFWVGCAGHKVTVTVSKLKAGRLEVRATFLPPDPKANKAFQLLIERSIAQARTR